LEIKSKYEKAVEDRNTIGVQLIDRNDELCILYERSNQQHEAFKKGEMEMIKKEEELRMLKIHIDELRRRYYAAERRLPELEKYRVKISEIEDQLAIERKRTDELSLQLEDPKNTDRWRPLEGDDPSMEQLTSKIKLLEERLDNKREQLLEKELILEEIDVLTDKLRSQAINRRDQSKSMSEQLNSLHFRVRDITKQMLATVSELSMYQVICLQII
jgi:chromosome segregation ATPase